MLLRKYALVENKEICSNLFLPEMFVNVKKKNVNHVYSGHALSYTSTKLS